LTDIASGWTEAAPIVVREGTLVVETLERIRIGLPFALRALDVDNVLNAIAGESLSNKHPSRRAVTRRWHLKSKRYTDPVVFRGGSGVLA
jgi:hypothetical protein